MIGPSRTSPMNKEREETPPPAPDVTADPRAPRSTLSSPSSTTTVNQSSGSAMRNNEVRQVMLYGIPIVALVIDEQERLCLAQISNTLLKNFSYNEIHNRRVALGITCVQCTPVQLELLRRAGAMPVSSRRCGLITKREAERLCKSFLADTTPPRLPDNFAFDVFHQCAWGCRGSFVPSRYNSSRAKCIKCTYCGLFFSPNKFIFHSHRLPDSKYVQPDAANFNSWRRHIKLSGTPPNEVIYAWEDVKAMFNGGSRKRVMTTSVHNVSRSQDPKRSRLPPSEIPTTNSEIGASGKQSFFPIVPLPNKGYSLQSAPSFVPPTPPSFSLPGKAMSSADIRQSFAEYMWAGKQPFSLPYGGVLWPRPPGLVSSVVDVGDNRTPDPCATNVPFPVADPDNKLPRPLSSASDATSRSFPLDHEESNPDSPRRASSPHASAFRPVGRLGSRALHLDPSASEATADASRVSEPATEIEPNARSADFRDDSESSRASSDHDEVDVTDISDDGAENNDAREDENKLRSSVEHPPVLMSIAPEAAPARPESKIWRGDKEANVTTNDGSLLHSMVGFYLAAESPNRSSENYKDGKVREVMELLRPPTPPLVEEKNTVSPTIDPQKLSSLSKDELREVLMQETQARHQAEREYQMIRGTFEEQVRKEIAYREEIAKQLQLVRGMKF
ncbi:SKI family transcriptional corepressor 2-like [Centruroides sculpturatus]|uniref:SKI family transcriptional corepressor 2-like n=1 Tax=Centruroides sculpturatus TaxID=218467 RepID=UPI000C6D647C|nr:SKI family transcriptional corepressor 2-like [Centruroides sculpturatus]